MVHTKKGPDKNIARAVGALILTATATYMVGSGLVASIITAPDFLLDVYANNARMTAGVLLQFVNCAAVASEPVQADINGSDRRSLSRV
jgi:amino acid transporter